MSPPPTLLVRKWLQWSIYILPFTTWWWFYTQPGSGGHSLVVSIEGAFYLYHVMVSCGVLYSSRIRGSLAGDAVEFKCVCWDSALLSLNMCVCCRPCSRFAEGDLHDWRVDRRPSPARLSVRPWRPRRERPRPDPFLDPQVPRPSPYQQPLSLWDSMFTVAPPPHPQWAPLVRATVGQKICTVLCFFGQSCVPLIQDGQIVKTGLWGILIPCL